MTPRHKNSTATFEQLDYPDQARSINQAIINLERMIRATVRKATQQGRNVQQVLDVKRGQLQRLLHRI